MKGAFRKLRKALKFEVIGLSDYSEYAIRLARTASVKDSKDPNTTNHFSLCCYKISKARQENFFRDDELYDSFKTWAKKEMLNAKDNKMIAILRLLDKAEMTRE